MRKKITSLLIASLCTVFAVFAATFFGFVIETSGSAYSDIRIPFYSASIAGAFSLAVVIFWALPIHFILNRFNKEGYSWYLIAGVIPSFIVISAFIALGNTVGDGLLIQVLFLVSLGGLGSCVFWYIAVYRPRIKHA